LFVKHIICATHFEPAVAFQQQWQQAASVNKAVAQINQPLLAVLAACSVVTSIHIASTAQASWCSTLKCQVAHICNIKLTQA
jgi:hypothetical protein